MFSEVQSQHNGCAKETERLKHSFDRFREQRENCSPRTNLRVPDVGSVKGCEGHPMRRLNDGLGLAVQPKLAVFAVASPELLARYREDAVRAIAYEDRVDAGCDEYPDVETGKEARTSWLLC